MSNIPKTNFHHYAIFMFCCLLFTVYLVSLPYDARDLIVIMLPRQYLSCQAYSFTCRWAAQHCIWDAQHCIWAAQHCRLAAQHWIGLHNITDGLYNIADGLHNIAYGLHNITDGLHCIADGLHNIAYGLHNISDGLHSIAEKYCQAQFQPASSIWAKLALNINKDNRLVLIYLFIYLFIFGPSQTKHRKLPIKYLFLCITLN